MATPPQQEIETMTQTEFEEASQEVARRMRVQEAAPDMLEALRSAEESIATFIGVHGYPIDSGAGDVLRQVSAAIAKATGK